MTNKEAIAFLENMIDRESIFFGDVAIWQYHVEALQMSIKALSEDAVSVVRCKNCRFHEQEQPGMVYCPAIVGGWVDEDWFCKDGKRRRE